MKKLLIFTLLLMAICTSSMAQKGIVIHDIEKDFPTTKTLSFSKIQTFEIMTRRINAIMIKDSSMIVAEDNIDTYGHCYNINSGKKFSTLIGRGRAGNETSFLVREFDVFGDSILFDAGQSSIKKSFAINDILTKPLGERGWSIVEIPDSISFGRFKSSKGQGLGKSSKGQGFTITAGAISLSKWTKVGNKIFGVYGWLSGERDEKYFTIDGDKVSNFGKMNKELYEGKISNSEMSIGKANFAVNKNKIVHFMQYGFLLEVIDIDKKAVDINRYYNKIQKVSLKRPGGSTIEVIRPTGDLFDGFRMEEISCTDEEIYCLTRKWNAETRKYAFFIYVFDWELNPVQKYELDLPEDKFGNVLTCCFTDDGKFYYLHEEEETQELFMAEIK